jgi:hypothetical protein
MSSLIKDLPSARAVKATANAEELIVDLEDGRTIIAPLGWFPRLAHATQRERNTWRLSGKGMGIHWPDLDEDISVQNLLLGQSSRESQASLKKWLDGRSGKKRKAGN